MNKLSDVVSDIVRFHTAKRRVRLGVVYSGHRDLAEGILSQGHRTVVMGERFHPLYRLYRRHRARYATPNATTMMVEVADILSALPVRKSALDVLVLTSGLPASRRVSSELERFRELISPNGLLVWAHPLREGAVGRITRRLRGQARRPTKRLQQSDLCRLAMEAGFSEVGQKTVPRAFTTWVVTTGIRGARPWRDPEITAPPTPERT